MRTLLRRRAIASAIVVIVLVAVAAGAAWYLLSEERRMGSIVERALVQRTGLPLTVQRASWNGRRFFLSDVRLAPGSALPLDVRVSELAIDAGILSLVAPAGRKVSASAGSASISFSTPLAADGSGVDALRSQLLSLLGWSGELTIRAERAELRTSAGAITGDLALEKQSLGSTLTLTVMPQGGNDPLRVNVRGFAALGRALDVIIDVAGSPRALGAIWPAAAASASPVAARVQLQLLAGGVVSSVGKLSVGTNAADRIALDFTSRYNSTSGDLGVSRYALAWGDVRLSGTATMARETRGHRVSATAAGDAAGSTVNATGRWEPAGGAFEADIRLDGADAGRVARRLGVASRVPATARSVHARLSGRADAKTLQVFVDAAASSVTLGSAAPR